jgi:hypothetical protein
MGYPAYLILSVFIMGLFSGFICGSRTSVGMFLLLSGFGFLQDGFLIKRFFSVFASISLLGIFLFYFGGSLANRFETAYGNFEDRVDTGNESGELAWRIDWTYNEIINYHGNYPIYGIGLGSTYQGANILFGESSYAKEYGYYESELGRIVLEGGFILFFFRIIMFLVVLRFSHISFAGKIIMFIFFFNNMIIFNAYLGAFFILGFILVDRAYYLKRNYLLAGNS